MIWKYNYLYFHFFKVGGLANELICFYKPRFSVINTKMWLQIIQLRLKHIKGPGVDLRWNIPDDHETLYRIFHVRKNQNLSSIMWLFLVYLDVPCHTDKLCRHQTLLFNFHLKALCHVDLVNIKLIFPFPPNMVRIFLETLMLYSMAQRILLAGYCN